MKVRQVTPPYLLPAMDAVTAAPWLLADGEPLPERLANWDPATDLEVVREVTLNRDRLIAAGLGEDTRVRLVATARSDLTRLRIVGAFTDVDLAAFEEGPRSVSLRAKGETLGGTVTLSTRLVWMSGFNPTPLGPVRPGSELWGDEMRSILEGQAARFPVSAVSFSSLTSLDPAASWTLDWEPSRFEEPVMGAVRLLVNTDQPRVRASIVSEADIAGADAVRAFVHFDVARTLITTALASEEFVERAESYPEGTVGRTIADLLDRHWEESPTALAARARDFPRQFEMELQARFRPMPETG